MKILICLPIWILLFAPPAMAMEITAPEAPAGAEEWMPEATDSLDAGLGELGKRCLEALGPALREGAGSCMAITAAVLLTGLLQTVSGPSARAASVAGTTAVGVLLLSSADALIRLGTETVTSISEYGKLLIPVMTTAMAARGGVTGAAALYAGTALFNTLLTTAIRRLLVPGIWLYLALAVAARSTGEPLLKRLGELLKGSMVWGLKTILIGFTTYLGLTGVVSGTTDAAALKAAKVTISTVVPVVGGILSEASEAVLVSTGLLGSAAGIYGILAVLSLFLGPFLKISAQYVLLKLTAALCTGFGEKSVTELVGDFCTALGLLLAMTGSGCVMMLVSTVCFLREVGS